MLGKAEVTVELIERFLDDSIDAEQAQALLKLVAADPAFKREFAGALRMHGLLQEAAHSDRECGRLARVVDVAIRSKHRGKFESRVMAKIGTSQIKRPRVSRKWAWAAAACALGAIGVFFITGRAPDVRVSAAASGVVIQRGSSRMPAKGGLALGPGDSIQVPPKAWASIAYADGTSVHLSSDTSALLETPAKKIFINRGALTADVAPQSGDPMLLRSPHAEARILGTRFALHVAPEATRLVVREGKVRLTRRQDEASIDVPGGHAATAAPGRELASESIFPRRFMLGVMSDLGDKWIADSRAQGARWDARYQHLSGGAGVKGNWTQWNPGGSFVPMYLQESDRLGVFTVFTYYQMRQSAPKAEGDAGAMRAYLSELKLFFQKAGEYGKPLILHAEPGLWADLLAAPVRVVVKSTGLADFEGLDDSMIGLAKAFGLLRDRYAPNVLLAWHASKRPGLSAEAIAQAFVACGNWDLIFTDVGDRDAGFTKAWWNESDFTALRDWGAEIHRLTGAPLMVWRIPLGNTHMATCNNTPWHYMDNRVEYWLENYPVNRRIAEWAERGFIGLLFGGGTIGSTVVYDNAKDGTTNPAPVPGNKGEKSEYADDDGGYLRLRGGNYYRSGPHPLSEKK